MPESQVIEISDIQGIPLKFEIYAETQETLWFIGEEEAYINGESRLQVLEGNAYEYKLPDIYRFADLPGIIKPSKRDKAAGRLTPGIFVGTLILIVVDEKSAQVARIAVEVRSIKASYRMDYRFMLEEIAKYCTDLIMQIDSPAVQNFATNYESNSETAYQRFAFVKSLIDSEEFSDAVHKIVTEPVTKWVEIEELVDVRNVKRLSGSALRQLASSSKRVDLPNAHPLRSLNLNSVPERVQATRKKTTIDTPENRFVKHVLNTYSDFCLMIQEQVKSENYPRCNAEAVLLYEKLQDI